MDCNNPQRRDMNRNERIAILIDLSNLEKSVEGFNEAGWSLDYSDLVRNLALERDVVGVTVYDSCPVAENTRRMSLHESLRTNGFEMRVKEPFFNRERSEMIQKEVDTSIVADGVMMACKDVVDTVVIVSGDRDMRPAVETIRKVGKSAEVASYPIVLSDELRDSCDRFHDLEDMYILCPGPMTASESAPNIASTSVNPKGCVHGQ